MASIRNRTVRRSTTQDVSGQPIDFAVNESLARLIESEAASAYKKPWHRLERGLRLNRLRLFVKELGEKRGLKETERLALFGLLSKALDKKILNSKAAVDYDPETEAIREIKPLVMHQSSTGEVLFQLLEKRNAVTFRKRSSAPSVPSAGPAVSAEGAAAAGEPIEGGAGGGGV
jgi:hypothetical protein